MSRQSSPWESATDLETPDGNSSSPVRERLYRKYRSNQGFVSPDEERRQRAPYDRRLIKTHFPTDRNARILDLGCGNGTLLYFLREAGYENVSGIDTSPEQVDEARQLGFGEVREADAFTFLKTVADGSFECVVAFDIIEHLTTAELLHLADEIYRILAPAGVWIIHAPNAEGFFGGRMRYSDLTHEQAFTLSSVDQLARAAGFRTSECFEDAPVAHGLKSTLRLLVWKVERRLLRILLMAETGDAGRKGVFSQNLLAVVRK